MAHIPLSLAIKLGPIDAADAFPFSSWSLYTRVPNRSVVYSVEILRVGESDYLAPIDFLDAKTSGTRRAGIWAHHVIQDFGRAVERGDHDEAARLRDLLENAYLPMELPVEYRLVRKTLDPLEYLRSGAVDEELDLIDLRTGEE